MPIYPNKYTKYAGPREATPGWAAVFWNDFRIAIGNMRTKLVILLCWIPSFLGFLGIIGEAALRKQLPELLGGASPGGSVLVAFMEIQFFSLVILYAVSGCNIVTRDIQNQTFPLYFSRPLSTVEYVFGKTLSLFAVGSIVTVGPVTLLSILRVIYYSFYSSGAAQSAGVQAQMLSFVGLSILLTALCSLVVVALSATVEKQSISILSWIGVVLVPFLISRLALIVSDGTGDWTYLLSLDGNIQLLSEYMLDTPPSISPLVPLGIVSGIGILTASYLYQRVSALKAIE